MNTTTECPDINSAKARRRRRRAMGVIVAGAAAIALLALFDTAWPGANEATLLSSPVHLVDQATQAPSPMPLRVQQVDDSDQDAAQQQENNALQTMIQSEQQAEQQNDQAEQQFTEDELQAQQTEQQADQS
jgi:phosphatidylserine/phosphatidylglycerophosphate/cardiolipin synthase-like enzyme